MRSAKYLSWKSHVAEVSVVEVPGRGSVLREVSFGELSSRETLLKSLVLGTYSVLKYI